MHDHHADGENYIDTQRRSSDRQVWNIEMAQTPNPGDEVEIQAVDMEEEMQKQAIEVSIAALEINDLEMDVAAHIKREFDKKYGSPWHCIVGTRFGSFVTHEDKV